MVSLSSRSSFASYLMFISTEADGSESSASNSRAPGVFRGGLRQQADRISDWVIESMPRTVTKLNQAERKLFFYTQCLHRLLWTLSAT